MEFKFQKWRERKNQDFNKSKISITKAGKTYNVYDNIQESREDTEIYPTLEKYGCIEGHMLEDPNKIYADFQMFGDLRTMKEQQMKADEMFYNLPLEVRQKFNNDKNIFMKDGEKWIKEEIAKAEKLAKENTEKYTTETTQPELPLKENK